MTMIIFISLATLAVIVAAVIVLRKFPIVANLDLQNLTEEKESRKKRELIDKRLLERGREAGVTLRRRLVPLNKLWEIIQTKFRRQVARVEKLLHYEELIKSRQKAKQTTLEERNKEVSDLLAQARACATDGNYDKAEEFYIAVIKIDKKSADAYHGLADAYFAKGAIEEAVQTYDFLTRFLPNDDALLIKLSELAEERDKIEEAINYLERATAINDAISSRFSRLADLYGRVGQPELALEAIRQAVELEPRNPKYLDLLIENAILCADKKMAEKAYEDFRLVNPENQKLLELRARIDKI
jgi:tetratricopeptide (TPR) repeat protein